MEKTEHFRTGPSAQGPLIEDDGQSFNLPPILLQYWHTVLRWRWLMAGIVATCLVLGVVATLLMAPKYTATVEIQIDRQQKQITKVEGIDAQTSSQDLEFYATQYALLKTRSLAERVASDMNLYDNTDFLVASGIDPKVLTGKVPGKTNAQLENDRRERVINTLLRNVTISPIRMSKLVDVSYTSRNPALSAAIANKWAAAFIAISMDRQYASTADARAFLEDRINSLRQKLEDSEKRMVLYGSKSGIVTLDQIRDNEGRTLANRTLASANLEQLSAALNQATADRIAAQSRMVGDGESSTESISSATLSSLRQQRAQLAADYAKANVQYGPDYPTVRALSQQIHSVDTAIARETRRIADVHKTEYREALDRETKLKAQVVALKAELDRQNHANIQYNIYQREADTNRQLYDALLQRYKEIGVAGAVGVNNIAIVDQAITPNKPSSPKLAINLGIALLLGLGLAAVVTIALEQIDEGIREPAQVEPLLRLPLLGITPEVEQEHFLEELRDPKSHLFDAYYSIRSSLAFTTNHGLPQSFAVTSTRPMEGKTSTALALAQIIGRTGKNVLLIDADMRSPSIHSMVGCKNEFGLSNYLAGDNDLTKIIQSTTLKNLSIVSSGPLPPSAAELLSGDRLEQFLQTCRRSFDYIVIDCPPVLGMTDAPLIAKAAEGVVYVVQSAGAAVRGVRASIKRIRQVNGHIFGIVLSKVSARSSGYGYGYGYGYGQRYGEDAAKG